MLLIIYGFCLLLIHELSHFLAALAFGYRLNFRFAWGRFGVPRFVWIMPDAPKWQQRVIAGAGFIGEGLCASAASFFFGIVPPLVFFVHIVLYPFYAGEDSDFNFL